MSCRRPGRLFRLGHVLWGALNLAGLGWIWLSATRGRRDRLAGLSTGLLLAEGLALAVGRAIARSARSRRLGDPVPMFELILPRRAAKAAVPVLTVVPLAAMSLMLVRRPLSRARRIAAGPSAYGDGTGHLLQL